MTPKALLFDLDGTISDTHTIHLTNWLEVLRPHGVDADMDLYKESLKGRPNEEVVDELLPDLTGEEKRGLLKREAEGNRDRTAEAGAIAGLRGLLDECRNRGLGLALVSNAPKEDARKSLEALGSDDAFDPMVFAEDVGAPKPNPAPYEAALERLGVRAEEALAFEDSSSGAGGAMNAGIPVVGIVSTSQASDELREAGAEFVVGDFVDRAVQERLDARRMTTALRNAPSSSCWSPGGRGAQGEPSGPLPRRPSSRDSSLSRYAKTSPAATATASPTVASVPAERPTRSAATKAVKAQPGSRPRATRTTKRRKDTPDNPATATATSSGTSGISITKNNNAPFSSPKAPENRSKLLRPTSRTASGGPQRRTRRPNRPCRRRGQGQCRTRVRRAGDRRRS